MYVHEPGLATTIQDTGRFGYYHIGMPPSGAMDQFAHRVGNYLVGNDADAATVEMTYLGGDLEFEDDRYIAITGADMSPTIDGEPIPMWTRVHIDSGQRLSFEFSQDGVFSYLAVSGGFDVPTVMESRSTYKPIGIGGVDGRQLQAGDEVPVGTETEALAERSDVSVPEELRPTYGDDEIRVVMGLCDYRLTEEGRAQFLDSEWTVSDEADRVGYRFDGPDVTEMFEEREPPIGAGDGITNVVDIVYPVGSIQMAGQPIVLMRDAVTAGGFATVGTVISPDRDALAQCRTHNAVRFRSVDVETALAVRTEYDETLERIRDEIHNGH